MQQFWQMQSVEKCAHTHESLPADMHANTHTYTRTHTHTHYSPWSHPEKQKSHREKRQQKEKKNYSGETRSIEIIDTRRAEESWIIEDYTGSKSACTSCRSWIFYDCMRKSCWTNSVTVSLVRPCEGFRFVALFACISMWLLLFKL